MHSHFSRRVRPPACLALSLLWLAVAAPAQPSRPLPPADPSDAQVKVPPLVYQSALSRYRALQEPPALSWQSLNEATNRAGGWRAYAREVESPEPPAAPAATQPDTKRQPGHHGHRHHAPR